MMRQLVVFLTLLSFLAACGPPTPAADDIPDGQLYAVSVNGQVAVAGDGLRIGAGNLAREAFVDDHGRTTRGYRVGLWFFFRDAPEKDFHVRVYEGQTIDVPGYRVQVVEINPEDEMIVLSVSQVQP